MKFNPKHILISVIICTVISVISYAAAAITATVR